MKVYILTAKAITDIENVLVDDAYVIGVYDSYDGAQDILDEHLKMFVFRKEHDYEIDEMELTQA